MPTVSSRVPDAALPVISDRLHCIAGPFGAVQLVATPQRVLVNLQPRNYTVSGCIGVEHGQDAGP